MPNVLLHREVLELLDVTVIREMQGYDVPLMGHG